MKSGWSSRHMLINQPLGTFNKLMRAGILISKNIRNGRKRCFFKFREVRKYVEAEEKNQRRRVFKKNPGI